MRYGHKQSYTLVEILVVIAIIGILLSISIPAFEKITKGNRVNNAAASIGTALSLARSQAISMRQRVAVILPTTTTAGVKNKRSIRLAYVNSANNFTAWLPGSKWLELPEGTLFAEADNATQWQAVGFTSLSNISNVNLDGSLIPLTGIVFTPYGSVDITSPQVFIMVTDGVVNSVSGVITYTSYDGSKPLNTMEITINKFTGRASYE